MEWCSWSWLMLFTWEDMREIWITKKKLGVCSKISWDVLSCVKRSQDPTAEDLLILNLMIWMKSRRIRSSICRIWKKWASKSQIWRRRSWKMWRTTSPILIIAILLFTKITCPPSEIFAVMWISKSKSDWVKRQKKPYAPLLHSI